MKKTILFMLALLPATLFAQLLRVEVPDTALQRNALFLSQIGIEPMKFDAKGVFVYSNPDIKKQTEASISLGDFSSWTAILEPGQLMTIKISRKNGQTVAAYKGANKDMALLKTEFDKFRPEKHSWFEESHPSADTITYEEAFGRLDSRYAVLNKMISKIKDANIRKAQQEKLEMQYLDNRIELYSDRDNKYKRNYTDDAPLQQLLAMIDPSSEKFFDAGLTTKLVNLSIPVKVKQGEDVTDYAIAYVNTVNRLVKNPKIKFDMDDYFLSQVLGTDSPFDVNSFWKVVNEKCDTALVHRYQFMVDSRNNTKSGMPCPDVTFTDIDGNKHRLSDYFGKYIFIDIWATWCGPCCMEIPYIEKHVEYYKDNPDIMFLSIGTDRTREPWLKKVQADKPQWPQMWVNKEENQIITKQWGVLSIPRFIIINPDGTIHNADAFRPSDDDFREKINAIIKK